MYELSTPHQINLEPPVARFNVRCRSYSLSRAIFRHSVLSFFWQRRRRSAAADVLRGTHTLLPHHSPPHDQRRGRRCATSTHGLVMPNRLFEKRPSTTTQAPPPVPNMNFIVEKRSARTARVWRSAGEKTRLKTCVRGGYEQQVAAGACSALLGFPHSE